ncbi:hypothetical protein EV191_101988 [Tamaricihabitans halophyticus]|uniref:Carbon monoxide dehydrogenase subunit G n=1 Tax=Tamaricihabitans halophyticus TaxID=1262583 RepID=A0A4V2SV40_9PSEU|nr:SRPBCC family protein [Tamaricihabitans halophyticus]TCP57036.1 hypothetical protein EV191_101988 [Tamaricihabitans halophyticus]
MRLRNEFRVAHPPAEVFALLADAERVAECLPDAVLTGRVDARTVAGELRLRLGRRAVEYTGTARFLAVSPEAGTVLVKASGAERTGQGDAAARVAATVSADVVSTAAVSTDGGVPSGTLVSLDTDLVVRGAVARFGKGVIGAVSERVVKEFAGNVTRALAVADHGSPAKRDSGRRGRRVLAVVGLAALAAAVAVRLRLRHPPPNRNL